MNNYIAMYQNGEIELNISIQEETIWLTQKQIVALFDSSKTNISEHIKAIFDSNELNRKATVRKFRTVQNTNIYHIGASLKDLGKKWFAFSKMDGDSFGILERLR